MSKKGSKRNMPKWCFSSSDGLMKREIEDAFVKMYIEKQYNPMAGKIVGLKFNSLIPYLCAINPKRWGEINPENISTTE